MTNSLDEEIEVVNIVGSGTLDIEIDVGSLASDLPDAEYNPTNYHRMYFRPVGDTPLVTLYRSGKYIITGANSNFG